MVFFISLKDMVNGCCYTPFHDWHDDSFVSCHLRALQPRACDRNCWAKDRLRHRNSGKSRQMCNQYLNFFNTLNFYCLKGSSEITHRLSLRILLGCWLLMMVVIMNAYTSTLTSNMTVPKWKPIPKSLKELAEMGQDYQVTIIDNYLLGNYFLVIY